MTTVADGQRPRLVSVCCRACGKELGERPVPRVFGCRIPVALLCDECVEAREQRRRETREAEYQAAVDAVRADIPGALASCGVPPRWRHASLDECPDLPVDLVEAARGWAGSPREALFLHGPPGSGKTWLAVSILARVFDGGVLLPREVKFIGERAYLEHVRASFGTPGVDRCLSSSHPRRARLLLLDDLGAGRGTDWVRDEVAALIEARHAAQLPTVFTSNLALDSIARMIDSRVASRLGEAGQVWEFPGKDLRIRASSEGKGRAE